jgi:hypothetical protein
MEAVDKESVSSPVAKTATNDFDQEMEKLVASLVVIASYILGGWTQHPWRA